MGGAGPVGVAPVTSGLRWARPSGRGGSGGRGPGHFGLRRARPSGRCGPGRRGRGRAQVSRSCPAELLARPGLSAPGFPTVRFLGPL